MAEFNKHKEVTSCWDGCPFYTVEGMEHMMYCNHPALDHPNYGGAIITQREREMNRAPTKCPLREDGATVVTKTVVFTGK